MITKEDITAVLISALEYIEIGDTDRASMTLLVLIKRLEDEE